MMTIVSPSFTVRENPASTRFGPNALLTSFSSIITGDAGRSRVSNGVTT